MPHYTSLRDYLRVIREQRVLIVLIVLAFVGAAIALSLRQSPVYEASAALSFRGLNEDLGLIGTSAAATQTPEERAATGAEEIDTFEMAQLASERLKPRLGPAAILSAVDIQAEARTNFVVITAQAGSAQRAADIANAFAGAARAEETRHLRQQYTNRAHDLALQARRNKHLSAYGRAINADRVQRLRALAEFATPVVIAVKAGAPDTPVSPQPVRNGLLGLLAGLTVALLVAFVRDGLDRRFRSSREMVDELRLPLLGHVRDEVLGLSISPNGRRALEDSELEAFRVLRTNLDFLDVDRQGTAIAVSSAVAEEGKSTVAGALAAAYSSSGRRVLLVEGDLRRPTLAKRLGLEAQPGLTDYLAGDAEPEDVLQTVTVAVGARKKRRRRGQADDLASEAPRFVCITAGTPTRRPAELLASERFERFLAEVEQAYDVVIVDTAPLLSIVDTLEIIQHVGRVVVCVRASRTTREQARAARAALAHFQDRPTGVVVTGVRPGEDAEYGYYSYAYSPDA